MREWISLVEDAMSAPEPVQKEQGSAPIYDAERLAFLTEAAAQADDPSNCVILTGMTKKEVLADLFGE